MAADSVGREPIVVGVVVSSELDEELQSGTEVMVAAMIEDLFNVELLGVL